MKHILIFGPHAEEYSLARVNRGIALALQQAIKDQKLDYKVEITGTLDQIANLPNKKHFALYEGLEEIYVEYDPKKQYDIAIYNNFPKDPNALFGLNKLNARVKLAYTAWEEDRFPQRWVDEYNQNLDALLVGSEHTKFVMKRSGVKLPIVVIPNALDDKYFQEELISQLKDKPNQLYQTHKNFIFYHNSTGIERKAPSELIEAYTKEFSAKDDVALVIKSFPNSTGKFPELVAKAKADPKAPEIILIESHDFTEADMMKLYLEADAYVCPSKAEGFNLPALEAMKLGTPVIATAWSGQMDFCSDENAFLIGYNLAPAKSHLDNPGAFWAEPDISDLRDKMRQVYTMSRKHSSQLQMKVSNAKQVADKYQWSESADKLIAVLPYLADVGGFAKQKLGVISTYNTICGIAEYSSYLYDNLKGSFAELKFIANKDATGRVHIDNESVIRLWEYGELDFSGVFTWLDDYKKKHKNYPVDLIHIQYSEGFYTLDALVKLIEGLDKRDIPTLLTAHAVQVEGVPFESIVKQLQLVEQIHVLNPEDSKFLQNFGLKNIVTLPHGNITLPLQSKLRLRKKLGLEKTEAPVIATHGFMSEGKGILEALRGIAQIHDKNSDVKYLAVNAVNPRNMTSENLKQRFETEAKKLGFDSDLIHISEFIEKEEVILALAAADIIVFSYPLDANQTASGSIRLAMAAGRPIVATSSLQLHDVKEFVLSIKDNEPQTIADAINKLLTDPNLYSQYQQKCLVARQKGTWDVVAIMYLHHLKALTL